MFSIASPKKLTRAGVIGINWRNLRLIAEHNPRRRYPLVDDKLSTKLITEGKDISVPRLLGVIKTHFHIAQLPQFLVGIDSFVVKPAKGSGGKGILVISGRSDEDFVKSSGSHITLREIQHHASNVLSGLFSLGGNRDYAMIEEMVQFSDVFAGFSFDGVPDVRVILYHGYPVMAMIRLPTHESDGKANLHQGAVGLGIDIATGASLKAVQHGRPIEYHPDTGLRLSDLMVPNWEIFLKLASRCYDVTKMGYFGADIVLDKNRGPLLLELNARPGLTIQIANGVGLQPRISMIDPQIDVVRTADERVRFSMRAFGNCKTSRTP